VYLKVPVLNCECAADAALTLPIWLPLLKSWAPCSVMFSSGALPMKNRVVVKIAVFWAWVPPFVIRRVVA
jgi:hypothetical protein